MPYGILKADTLTYYTATGDVSVAISGIAISGSPLISGVSGIFTTSVSGATVTGNAGQFTTITGGTAQFTNITGVSGTFTSLISGATVTGTSGQFTTLTATTGVFTTSISGATISGDLGLFSTISGSQGFFSSSLSVPSGTAGSPSISFNGDSNTGIYSPGADQVAISSNGVGRLFVDASGNVGVGTSPSTTLDVAGFVNINGSGIGGNSQISFKSAGAGASGFQIGQGLNSQYLYVYDVAANSERLRLDSSGRLGLGTSSPNYQLHVTTDFAVGASGFNQQLTFSNDTIQSLLLGTGYTPLKLNPLGGNVGIGSTGPGAKLQIDDTGTTAVNSASSSGVNRILVRDASGATTAGSGAAIDFEGVYGALGRIAFGKQDSSTSGGGRDRGDFYILQNQNGGQDGYGALYETLKISHGDGFVYKYNNNEKFRVDTSGRLLVGTSTARANFYNGANTAQIQLEGTNFQNAAFAIVCNANSDDKGSLILAKNRGTTVGSNTVVQDNDDLGSIEFQGSDGTEFVQAANIKAEVDGTPGTNDMPGRLVFSTTADGASSPTERVRISQNGVVTVKNGAVAEIGTLTDGGTITPDFAANCNFTATISGGSRTLANPSNITAGQTGSIFIIQGAGTGTISWGSYWDFAGGTAPTLTTTSGAVDRVDYVVRTSTSIHTVFTANYS